MPSDLIRGWIPVFPRDKREAFARRSCLNKKIERDDDSKKSHPALADRNRLGIRHSVPDCLLAGAGGQTTDDVTLKENSDNHERSDRRR
jgi:hypothetical protein